MKKTKITSFITILPLLALAFSVAAWVLAHDRIASQAGQGATKGKTLREIGQERDVESEVSALENNAEYDDLRLLAKHADAVVMGRIVEEQAAFDGEDHIVTRYVLDVTRILKDKTSDLIPVLRSLGEQESPAPLSTPLKVVREGGVVSVNGHRVAKTLKGSEGLKTGQSYILFVHWSRDFKAYRLAGGMSGAVLVEPELLVRPLGSEKGVTRLRGTRLDTFLEEVLADPCTLYSY